MNQVATRYAQVLLEVVLESGQTPSKISDELSAIEAVLAQSKELRAALRSPNLNVQEKSETISELAKGFSKETIHFLKVLVERSRLSFLQEIRNEFCRLYLKREGKLMGELISSDAMSQEEVAAITKSTSLKLGMPVVFTQKIDPLILGGFIAKASGITFDGSIRGQLDRLKAKLSEAQV